MFSVSFPKLIDFQLYILLVNFEVFLCSWKNPKIGILAGSTSASLLLILRRHEAGKRSKIQHTREQILQLQAKAVSIGASLTEN